jgi:hypothetical protein
MKLVSIVLIAGIVLLYFIDSAFKLRTFDSEMMIHSGLRFFIGFLILGIGTFYAHKIKLKFAVCLVLALALGDDIWDYTRNVNSFNFEVFLHSLYMMAWGSLAGYVLMKQWLDRRGVES